MAYFVKKLGFTSHWPEATDWQLLSHGDVRVMIGSCPDTPPASTIGDHSYFAYLQTQNADDLYNDFKTRGALLDAAPVDKPYGMREFLVKTPDGHRMMVGQEITKKS